MLETNNALLVQNAQATLTRMYSSYVDFEIVSAPHSSARTLLLATKPCGNHSTAGLWLGDDSQLHLYRG